jgi:ABC-type transport system involved in multi-copper enzyme maturation permease subunit
MKIRTIGLNTFASLLRNKIIILFSAGFICILLLMMTPLLAARAMGATATPAEAQGMVLGMVGGMMSMVSGFGSLLAAWAAADVVASEMKSGTILAVMARPVRRWEFLLGKYLGVQILMAVYVVAIFSLSYLLAWIGGERIQAAPWTLIVYPLVRFALYSALATFLATRLHPVVSFAIILVIAVAASIFAPSSHLEYFIPDWLRQGIYFLLPSTGLLSETRFLTFTQASLRAIPWTAHSVAIGYGLDYALVCFLLAVWCFRKRSLTTP